MKFYILIASLFFLNLSCNFIPNESINEQNNNIPILFEKYPKLQSKIPYVSLCSLPTPISRLENLGNYLKHENIFIKRDDLTGKHIYDGFRLYGGNKPRKLEFLLADALKKEKKLIITYGCAGSNHALSTAVYSKELGLQSILMLKNQPNSYVVRQNLLLDNYYKAELRFFPNNKIRSEAAEEILKNNSDAYLIPTGGSNFIGVLGFVNAAFELAKQIKEGQIPEPDLIYVATGSCATTAGLLLGIKAVKLTSKVVAICVEPEEEKDEILSNIKNLFSEANELLNSYDSSFEIFTFSEDDLLLNKKFCGTEYGLFIPEAMNAIKLAKDKENIQLEGTYSAKPIAAIIDDVSTGDLRNKVILFWNTYCGIDFSTFSNFSDYKKLPQEFHRYFQEDVQSLAN